MGQIGEPVRTEPLQVPAPPQFAPPAPAEPSIPSTPAPAEPAVKPEKEPVPA